MLAELLSQTNIIPLVLTPYSKSLRSFTCQALLSYGGSLVKRTGVPILRQLPLLGAKTDKKQGHMGMSRC